MVLDSCRASNELPARSDHATTKKAGRCLSASLWLFVVAFQAVAQDIETTTFGKRLRDKGLYEQLWDATRLYENKENPVIQAFSLIGRYNGQYWFANADQGKADGWENRRFYAGMEAVLFRDLTVQAQMKFSEDFDPIYMTACSRRS